MYSIIGVISRVLLFLYDYVGYLFGILRLQYRNISIVHRKTLNHNSSQRKHSIVNIRENNNNYLNNSSLLDTEATSNEKSEIGLSEKVSYHSTRLLTLCHVWEDRTKDIPIDDNNRNDHEAINEELAAIVGKTRLLIDGKFRQFESLIAVYNDTKNNQDNKKNMKITQQDLQGFWELIDLQIKDLDTGFDHLNTLYGNSNKI